MEKKNPFVTTVGFKKDDPDHVYVAELLNSMGRGKAQYIVKAVMLYQDMRESGETVPTGGAYDYERIRRVVLQVMEERERILLQSSIEPSEENIQKNSSPKGNVFFEMTDNAIDGIMASLAAFKQQ